MPKDSRLQTKTHMTVLVVYPDAAQETHEKLVGIARKQLPKDTRFIPLPYSKVLTGHMSFALDFADAMMIISWPKGARKYLMAYTFAWFLEIPHVLVDYRWLQGVEQAHEGESANGTTAFLRFFDVKLSFLKTLVRHTANTKQEFMTWLRGLRGGICLVCSVQPKTERIKISRLLVLKSLLKGYSLGKIRTGVTNFVRNFASIKQVLPKKSVNIMTYFIDARASRRKGPIVGQGELSDRKLLIFFPGITARYTAYLPMLEKLRERYDIVTLDMPLHGMSDKHMWMSDTHTFAGLLAASILVFVSRFAPGATLQEKMQNTVLLGHSLGAGMLTKAANLLENALQMQFGKLFVYSPIGFQVSHGKFYLFLKGNKLKIQHWTSYYKFTRHVKKGIVDGFINLAQNYNGSFKKSPMFRLYLQLEKGIPEFEKIFINTKSVLVFADKDHYFNTQYRLRFARLFRLVKYLEVQGLHDWPVIKPAMAAKIVLEEDE